MRVSCDQCQALVINGVPSHEIGCPNRKYDWEVDEKWQEIRPNTDQGEDLPEYPPTNCYDYEDI